MQPLQASPTPAGHPAWSAFSVGGLLLGGTLLLAVAALQPLRGALLLLAAVAGLAGLTAIVLFARGRLSDLLYLGLLALASVPIDKYFAYRDHVGGWPGLRFAASDLLLVALIPLALFGGWLGRVHNRIPRIVWLLYGLLLGQYALSALGAPERALALFEIVSAVHVLLLAAVCAALFRRRYLSPFLALLCLLTWVHTAFAVAQTVTGRPLGLGLGDNPDAVIVESLTSGVERLRPSGLFDHPIVYADFLLIGLPLLFAGFLFAQSRLARAGLGATILVGASGLVLTLSRGAWISSAVATVLFVGLAWRQGLLAGRQARRILRTGAVVGLVALVAFAPRIIERLTSSVSGNLEVRFELNEIALRMIAAHPLRGVGLNNFLTVMEGYDPKDVMEYFPATVHNLYLLEAAEAGLPALLLFVALWTAIIVAAWRQLAAVQDPALRGLAVGLIAGLCGFLLSQVADFSHRIEPLHTLVWLHVGLLFGALAAGRTAPQLAPQDGPRTAFHPDEGSQP